MPKSNSTNNGDIRKKEAYDVELAALQSSDVIEHKAQDGQEADRR